MPAISRRALCPNPRLANNPARSVANSAEFARHRIHKEASFSDEDSSLATTTAGLGSLFNFPLPRKHPRPETLDENQLVVTHDVACEDTDASQLPLTPMDSRSSFSCMDSLDETSMFVTMDESVMRNALDFK